MRTSWYFLVSFFVNNVNKTACKFLTVSNMICLNIHVVNKCHFIYCSNLSLSISSSTWSLNSSSAITDLSLIECREPSELNKEGGVTENSYLPRQNCRSISDLVLDATRSLFINFHSSLMAMICWLAVTIAILLLETNVPIFYFFMVSHIDLLPKKIVSALNKKLYIERGSILARIDFHHFHAFYCLTKTSFLQKSIPSLR